MLYICAKFREIILNGIKVIERTQMINRWLTDGRTDTQKFGGYNIIPRHFLWRGIKNSTTSEIRIKNLHLFFHLWNKTLNFFQLAFFVNINYSYIRKNK